MAAAEHDTFTEERMRLVTSVTVKRGGGRLLVLCALTLASSGCRYTHGRIHVDGDTKDAWNAGEKDAERVGKLLQPVPPDPANPDALVPVAYLDKALAPVDSSLRHGANDKRMLTSLDGKQLVSSGIVAEVTLVKGSEYKEENDFENGWIPVAIVYRPPKGRLNKTYEELHLHAVDNSYIFVRKASDHTWKGSIVWKENDGYHQDTIYVSTEAMPHSKTGETDPKDVDSLEPVIGARFVWQDNDEIMWAYCGGKCCQMRGIK
jgi:hypothetical protein